MRQRPTLAIIGFSMLCLGVFIATATVCEELSLEANAQSAAIIFSGKVISIASPVKQATIEFEVFHVFKGPKKSLRFLLEWIPPLGSLPSRGPFELGESYLVYARSSIDGILMAHHCDRLRPLHAAEWDVIVLNRLFTDLELKMTLDSAEMKFTVIRGQNRSLALEQTIDLNHWTPITRIHPRTSVHEITLPRPLAAPHLFYRVREVEAQQGIYGLARILPGECTLVTSTPADCSVISFPPVYQIRETMPPSDLKTPNSLIQEFHSSFGSWHRRLSSTHEVTLDQGLISEDLKEELKTRRVDFSPASKIQIHHKGSAWFLIDPIKKDAIYIQKQTQYLTIDRMGFFRIPTPPGTFDIWNSFNQKTNVKILPKTWQFVYLEQFSTMLRQPDSDTSNQN